MSDKIDGNEIFSDDLFQKAQDGARNFITAIKDMRDELEQNLKLSEQFIATWSGNKASDLVALNKAMTDSTKVMGAREKLKQEELKTEKELEKLGQQRQKTIQENLKILQEEQKLSQNKVKTEQQLIKTEQEEIKLAAEKVKLQKLEASAAEQVARQRAKEAKEIATLNSKYKQQSALLNDLRNRYKELAIAGRENGKVGRAIKAEIDGLDTKLKKVDASVGQFQRNVGNYASGFAGFGKQVQNFGRQLLNVAGIAGGVQLFKSAIDQIEQFDQSLADLRSILGLTANSPEYKFLEAQSLKIAKGIKVGNETISASAKDIVEAYKLIGSAKPELLENVDLLNKTTEAALLLAKASGLELPDAATRLTDTLNQFNLSGKESGRVINVLAAGAKFGSAEIPQVTDALLQFGTIAKNANVSVEESVGLIEAFAERGLKGAEAGTKLRNILLTLSATKALDKGALDELKAAGVNLDVVSNNALTLEDRLKELTKIQGNQTAIVKVFGKENAAAGNILLDNTAAISSYTQKVEGTNTVQEQAEERAKTLGGELENLKNAWQAAVIEFGQGGGDIRDAIRFIRENLDTIINVALKVVKTFLVFRGTTMLVTAAIKTGQIATQAWAIATKGLTGGLGGALKAFKAMDNAMKATVIGAVVAGVFALADALGVFKSAADLAAESQERVNAALDASQESINKAVAGYQKLIDNAERAAKRQIDILKAQGKDTSKLEEELRQKKQKIIDKALLQEERSRAKAGSRAADLELQKMGLIQQIKEDDLVEFQRLILAQKLQEVDEELQIENGKIEQLRAARLEFLEQDKDIENERVIASIESSNMTVEGKKKATEDAFNNGLAALQREKDVRDKNDEEQIKDADQLNLAKQESNYRFLNERQGLEETFKKDTIKTELEIVQAFKKFEEDKLAIAKRRMAEQKELLDLLDQLEIDNREEGRDRDKAQAQFDFEQEIYNLEQKGQLTAEIEKAMKEKLRKELAAIDKKYDDEEVAKVNEELAKIDEEAAAEMAKIEKAEEDKLKRRQEFLEKTLDLVEKELEREAEMREDAIEKNINRLENEVQRQQELAEKGLQNTLAFKEAALAKEELRREEERKRETRREKGIAFLRLIAGYADKEPEQAVRKALLDIALAEVIQAAFADGVENLPGPGTGRSDSIPAWLSRGESVITARATADEPGMATAWNEGRLDEYLGSKWLPRAMFDHQPAPSATRGTGDAALLGQLAGLNQRVDKLQEVIKNKLEMDVDWDAHGNAVVKTVENGMRTVIKHMAKQPRV